MLCFSCSMWDLWSSLPHVRSIVAGMFPGQGSNLGPLPWEHEARDTGSPGKSLFISFRKNLFGNNSPLTEVASTVQRARISPSLWVPRWLCVSLESQLWAQYLGSPTYPTHIPKQRSCHTPPPCNCLSQSRSQHWPTVPVRSSDCLHITNRDPALGVYPPWTRIHVARGRHVPPVSSCVEPSLSTRSYVLERFKACCTWSSCSPSPLLCGTIPQYSVLCPWEC